MINLNEIVKGLLDKRISYYDIYNEVFIYENDENKDCYIKLNPLNEEELILIRKEFIKLYNIEVKDIFKLEVFNAKLDELSLKKKYNAFFNHVLLSLAFQWAEDNNLINELELREELIKKVKKLYNDKDYLKLEDIPLKIIIDEKEYIISFFQEENSFFISIFDNYDDFCFSTISHMLSDYNVSEEMIISLLNYKMISVVNENYLSNEVIDFNKETNVDFDDNVFASLLIKEKGMSLRFVSKDEELFMLSMCNFLQSCLEIIKKDDLKVNDHQCIKITIDEKTIKGEVTPIEEEFNYNVIPYFGSAFDDLELTDTTIEFKIDCSIDDNDLNSYKIVIVDLANDNIIFNYEIPILNEESFLNLEFKLFEFFRVNKVAKNVYVSDIISYHFLRQRFSKININHKKLGFENLELIN